LFCEIASLIIDMSVVAVRKTKLGITIGSDSIRLSGLTQEKDKLAKLFMIGRNMALGAVGLASTTSLFREFLENHFPKFNSEYGWTMLMREFANYLGELKNAPGLETVELLVVYRGKIFYLSGYFVREIKDHYAIGAGKDYALTALYLGTDVRQAIQAACHLSILCEEPINILCLNTEGKQGLKARKQ
jgi:ATP-dependent protease HslVU (ClpYQ) peptidase subunit